MPLVARDASKEHELRDGRDHSTCYTTRYNNSTLVPQPSPAARSDDAVITSEVRHQTSRRAHLEEEDCRKPAIPEN